MVQVAEIKRCRVLEWITEMGKFAGTGGAYRDWDGVETKGCYGVRVECRCCR